MKHKKALSLAFLALFAIAIFAYCLYSTYPKTNPKTDFNWHEPDKNSYLVYAEVTSCDNGVTTFETQDGNLFEAYGEYELGNYMLTMYNGKTIGDFEDDEICVVWSIVEPVLG